jgi:hypothetical protein
VCLWSCVIEAICKEVDLRAGPHPTGFICQKVEVLFVPERYVRLMFPKRTGLKLAA